MNNSKIAVHSFNYLTGYIVESQAGWMFYPVFSSGMDSARTLVHGRSVSEHFVDATLRLTCVSHNYINVRNYISKIILGLD